MSEASMCDIFQGYSSWDYLKLELGRHDFGVGSSDLDPSVEAGSVMGLEHVTTKHFVRAHAAVVWTWTHMGTHQQNI